MKKYRVSQDLLPYVRKILTRREHRYRIVKEGDDYHVLMMISSEAFHAIIKRAACEKLSKESGWTYLTEDEASNPMRASRILNEVHATSFLVYKK